MSKKTNVTDLRRIGQDQAKAKVRELHRIQSSATDSSVILPTAIAQGVQSLKAQINRSEKSGLISGTTWELLSNLFAQIRNGIWEILSTTTEAYEKCQLGGVSDVTLDSLMLASAKDSEIYADRLMKVNALHKDKTGIVDESELEIYHQYGEDYRAIYEGFRNNAFQIGIEINAYVARLVEKTKPDQNLERVVEHTLEAASTKPA